MKIRLIDSSLSDIRNKLKAYSNKILKDEKKKDPSKTPLWVIVKRGDIEMSKGEWSNLGKEFIDNLTMSDSDIAKAFSKENLNMGILGYGNPKDGLSGLIKWAKHNVNPKRIKEDKRDLKIKVESLKYGKKGKKSGVQLELRVPEKGSKHSKDLENVKLENIGYVGLKQWTEDQLNAIKDSDKPIDKILYKILTGKAKLKDKVEEVIK